MMFEKHCAELADLAELVVDENKHALRLASSKQVLNEREEKLIASSLAAGIAQWAMLRMPLIAEAITLETPSELV